MVIENCPLVEYNNKYFSSTVYFYYGLTYFYYFIQNYICVTYNSTQFQQKFWKCLISNNKFDMVGLSINI